MKRTGLALCLALLAAGLFFLSAGAADGKDKAAETNKATDADKATVEAKECYEKIVDCYMHSKWPELVKTVRSAGKHHRFLTPQRRKDIVYIRKTANKYRPSWWKYTKSSKNASFKAKIWGRTFTANYVPSETLGVQAAVGIRRGRIIVIVSWKPGLVDNPKPAGGKLAEIHGMTKGDIGEVIVWHELGHNYITEFLPLKHIITLYNDYYLLFSHLQEFYADITSIYHCSPHARLAAMMLRLDEFRDYSEGECHTRAGHAIGSLILSHVLSRPEDLKRTWPSIHLPPKVPDKEVELKTLIYMYEHIDPKWTLAEDRQLREFIRKFIMSQGEKVLRRGGELKLPGRLSFKLMVAEDRDWQQKRDQWVREKLAKVIELGFADKPAEKDEKKTGVLRISIPD